MNYLIILDALRTILLLERMNLELVVVSHQTLTGTHTKVDFGP
jgi:hypothetical protein